MKTKLFLVLLSLSVAFGASAQRGGHAVVVGHGGYYHGGWYPRSYVGVGIGLGYPWWGWGYGWYGPWYGGYPAYYYGYGAMPNQLELQVQDIRNEYSDKIKEVRHDKALSHRERRQQIDQLKVDRDAAIVQARHDYFNNSRRNYNNQYPNQNGQPGNGNQPNQQHNNQQPGYNNQQPGNNNQQPGNNGSSSDGPEYQNPGTAGGSR